MANYERKIILIIIRNYKKFFFIKIQFVSGVIRCKLFLIWAEQKNLNRNGLCPIQAQGCGRNLDWTQMEDVTEMVNKQITEIYMDSYDNKVKEKIQTVKVDIFNK